MLVDPSPRLLSICAMDMLLGLGRPHALLEDVPEVEIELELDILWLLLQPSVLLLLPSTALEDEWIEAEDTHHFLHVFRGVCRTQRGTSRGGWGLHAVGQKWRGGLDYERGVERF